MVEKSYFWDIPGVGDYDASITEEEYALVLLLASAHDRTKVHVASLSQLGFAYSSLEPGISGANFTLSPGVALVDGWIYQNDATVTLAPGSGNGYYAIVLRRDNSGGGGTQTVRAALLYNAGSAPTPTQTTATWETVVAQGQVVAGTPQIDEDHRYTVDSVGVSFPARQGDRFEQFSGTFGNIILRTNSEEGEKDWSKAGTYFPQIESAGFQVGSIAHTPTASTAEIDVVFPVEFRAGYTPDVFVQPYNLSGGTPSHSAAIAVHSISSKGFTIYVNLDTNILGFFWVATCEEAEYA